MSSNPVSKRDAAESKKRIFGSSVMSGRRSERVATQSPLGSVSNAHRKITFGRHTQPPKSEIKEEENQDISIVKSVDLKSSRKSIIPISPLQPTPLEKLAIKVKTRSIQKSPNKSGDKDDFSFSAVKQKEKSPFRIKDHVPKDMSLNDSFADFQSTISPAFDKKINRKQQQQQQQQQPRIPQKISSAQRKDSDFQSLFPTQSNNIFNVDFDFNPLQKNVPFETRYQLPKQNRKENRFQPDTLFTKQQETLIDFNVEVSDTYSKILKRMNISATKSLSMRLDEILKTL